MGMKISQQCRYIFKLNEVFGTFLKRGLIITHLCPRDNQNGGRKYFDDWQKSHGHCTFGILMLQFSQTI